MTDHIMHISQEHDFYDAMDDADMIYSHDDFLCAPASQPQHEQDLDSSTRCISIGSSSASSQDCSYASSSSSSRSDDIFDEYDVHPTVLGTGHYGCVRECVHRSTGARRAVKTIDKSKVGRLDHIRREVDILRAVDHRGIMRMVDFYEDEDYVHIITEVYTGGELFDAIVDNTSDDGCLPEGYAAFIIKSLLESVQYLHERDIVHRDIKPENILFESREGGSGVKLIDFGLARTHRVKDGKMTNQVGTPYYMSPGVLAGKYDRSCDMWAVGIVAYILLAGYPPFNGSTDAEVHDSVRRGELVFERNVWSNLSREARDFVRRLLCRDSSEIMSADEALRHPWIGSV